MSPKVVIDNTIPTTVDVKRSWTERLFSWPWQPLKATYKKKVHYLYQYTGGRIRMNKTTYIYLRDKQKAKEAAKQWDANSGEDSSPSKFSN